MEHDTTSNKTHTVGDEELSTWPQDVRSRLFGSTDPKPIHPGVYRTAVRAFSDGGLLWGWSYWDGVKWCTQSGTWYYAKFMYDMGCVGMAPRAWMGITTEEHNRCTKVIAQRLIGFRNES